MNRLRLPLLRTCALTALMVLAACEEPAGPKEIIRSNPEETQPVRYPLRTVNGWSLPYLVGLTDTGQLDIAGGYIELTERTRYFEMRTLWRSIEYGEFWEDVVITRGRFTRVLGGLEVTTDDGRFLWIETSGAALLYHEGYLSYGYWR